MRAPGAICLLSNAASIVTLVAKTNHLFIHFKLTTIFYLMFFFYFIRGKGGGARIWHLWYPCLRPVYIRKIKSKTYRPSIYIEITNIGLYLHVWAIKTKNTSKIHLGIDQ